jgi:hypothetical protein
MNWRASTKLKHVLAVVPASFLVLSGCVSTGQDTVPVLAASVQSTVTPFPTEALIGNWGTASYREDKDIDRVTAQARQQCRLPYKITKGPTDGVMMYFADDPKLFELQVKSGNDGKVYVGFEGPPGGWQDREVLFHSSDKFILKFVDPEVHGRYGIFIFVRCK